MASIIAAGTNVLIAAASPEICRFGGISRQSIFAPKHSIVPHDTVRSGLIERTIFMPISGWQATIDMIISK